MTYLKIAGAGTTIIFGAASKIPKFQNPEKFGYVMFQYFLPSVFCVFGILGVEPRIVGCMTSPTKAFHCRLHQVANSTLLQWNPFCNSCQRFWVSQQTFFLYIARNEKGRSSDKFVCCPKKSVFSMWYKRKNTLEDLYKFQYLLSWS